MEALFHDIMLGDVKGLDRSDKHPAVISAIVNMGDLDKRIMKTNYLLEAKALNRHIPTSVRVSLNRHIPTSVRSTPPEKQQGNGLRLHSIATETL